MNIKDIKKDQTFYVYTNGILRAAKLLVCTCGFNTKGVSKGMFRKFCIAGIGCESYDNEIFNMYASVEDFKNSKPMALQFNLSEVESDYVREHEDSLSTSSIGNLINFNYYCWREGCERTAIPAETLLKYDILTHKFNIEEEKYHLTEEDCVKANFDNVSIVEFEDELNKCEN